MNQDNRGIVITQPGSKWAIVPPMPITKEDILAFRDAGLLEVTEHPDGSLECKVLPALFGAVDSNFGEDTAE